MLEFGPLLAGMVPSFFWNEDSAVRMNEILYGDPRKIRGDGGTGRHTGLKIQRGQPHESSTLSLRIFAYAKIRYRQRPMRPRTIPHRFRRGLPRAASSSTSKVLAQKRKCSLRTNSNELVRSVEISTISHGSHFLTHPGICLNRPLFFYTGLILVFLTAAGMVLKAGGGLTVQPALSSAFTAAPLSEQSSIPAIPLFIFQMSLIFAAAKAAGFIFQKIGQPAVMGEITAGILLGPSLLGWLAPGFYQAIFPETGLGALKLFSKIGILVFMFLIGMELDTEVLKKKKHETLMVSHAGILFPFFLGMLVSLTLYPVYGMAGTSFRAFSLFMGVAMSITAFPVLVRILEERGMTKTPLGTMAIACAAVDDVTAWCLLAGVTGIVTSQSLEIFLRTLLLTGIYAALMAFVVRPVIRKLTENKAQGFNSLVLLAVMVLSAWATEAIGIHALFGAFAAGVIAPNDPELHGYFRKKIFVINALLLPLFFALTGLRTQAGLLNSSAALISCSLIIVTAVLGKFGGSTLAARFLHAPWKEALSLGALMNTRGLMELVVLNVGYDLGILSPSIFAMMVLMALLTTFMTGPLLTFIAPDSAKGKASS